MPPPGMVRLPGDRFRMGSDRHYPEEAPQRWESVAGFWVDRMPVTTGDYARFVAATGYVSVAERHPNPADYPGADPASLVPGSIVFRPPPDAAALRSAGWWTFVPGACWRRPDGEHAGPADHPVVHVAHEDAAAYAAWTGKALPTEIEWEHAAWGGRSDSEFAWGDVLTPDGRHMANTWQGRFPFENLVEDGHPGTSPAGTFPANGFGLFDMIGNVWEWTADPWLTRNATHACCTPQGGIGRRVIKGGSHLCAPNYCQRYRPAARQPQATDSGTSHLGFRCVLREAVCRDPAY